MIDIGVVYYRIKAENEIDAIWYSSRQDKREIGTGIAKGDTSKRRGCCLRHYFAHLVDEHGSIVLPMLDY